MNDEIDLPFVILTIVPAAKGWRLVHFYAVPEPDDPGWEADPIACWALVSFGAGPDAFTAIRPVTDDCLTHGEDIPFSRIVCGRWEIAGPGKGDAWAKGRLADLVAHHWKKDRGGVPHAPGIWVEGEDEIPVATAGTGDALN